MTAFLFVEGGGNPTLDTACRRAFKQFLERAGFAGRLPRLFPCGGRNEAYKAFLDAPTGAVRILLVDSESPVHDGHNNWDHCGWRCPDTLPDASLHLMVQCMEAWLRADPNALAKHKIDASRLPGQATNIEAIRKADLLESLRRLGYTKSRGFDILAAVDPAGLKTASHRAALFFAQLDEALPVP